MAANLSKQHKVFNLVYDLSEDEVLSPKFLDRADYLRVHNEMHVDALQKQIKPNGFGDTSSQILTHAYQSCESFYTAALAAVNQPGEAVVFSPSSGFHHAGYDYSGGYCTFNGLLVAACKLKVDGLVDTVTIIDGDGHYGDGTQDIIDKLGLHWVNHVSLDKSSVKGSSLVADRLLDEAFEGPKPDLVMYQAGADCHGADPYNSGYLTDLEWKLRDAKVFMLCQEQDIPVVWNLAGGYNGIKTLNLHTSTFVSALQVFYPESSRLLFSPIGSSGTVEPSGQPL